MKAVVVYLGLGSNLGDRMGNLANALERLGRQLIVVKVSSVYETEPLYYEEQPRFLNAVLSATTMLAPTELLHFVKSIERKMGRKPGFRNAPRLIDIDILFYGDKVIHTDEVTIPHPRIAERAFVLVPLAEISPKLVHPVSQRKVSELLVDVEGRGGVKKVGKLGVKGKAPDLNSKL